MNLKGKVFQSLTLFVNMTVLLPKALKFDLEKHKTFKRHFVGPSPSSDRLTFCYIHAKVYSAGSRYKFWFVNQTNSIQNLNMYVQLESDWSVYLPRNGLLTKSKRECLDEETPGLLMNQEVVQLVDHEWAKFERLGRVRFEERGVVDWARIFLARLEILVHLLEPIFVNQIPKEKQNWIASVVGIAEIRHLQKLKAFPEMPDFCNFLRHIDCVDWNNVYGAWGWQDVDTFFISTGNNVDKGV